MISERPEWMLRAACRGMDTDMWFPDSSGYSANARKARAICATCPVREECASYAVANCERWGIWGGCNADQRRASANRGDGQVEIRCMVCNTIVMVDYRIAKQAKYCSAACRQRAHVRRRRAS
ncbi:MAG: WhiB family transcriptional regulator [Acidimicrobiales bacterium]